MRLLSELNQYRNRAEEAKADLFIYDEHDDHVGLFDIRTPSHPRPLRVVASRFRDHIPESNDNPAWNYLSISLPNRSPSWKELDFLKRLFFLPQEVVMQLYGAPEEEVTTHPFSIQLWQPAKDKLLLPPAVLQSVKALEII